jgi:tRNA pseudouridine38-40 synthase
MVSVLQETAEGRCSIQLSYGTKLSIKSEFSSFKKPISKLLFKKRRKDNAFSITFQSGIDSKLLSFAKNMARFKITLEYDGARYQGWQIQKDARSIQGVCMDACREVFQTEKFEFFGAGRTDTGVHALGQVAHLDVQTELGAHIIKMRLNDVLPSDVNILRVEKALARFHARHDATARSYVYQISRRRNAFGKKYMWWVKDRLDAEAMRKAARQLTGMHDFRSFSNEKDEAQSSLVKIERLEVMEQGDLILIHIIGSHFLWKMVRRITGVLVEVGRGKMEGEQIREMLQKASAEPAKYTAPPAGLFLERVYYDGDKFEAPRILFGAR